MFKNIWLFSYQITYIDRQKKDVENVDIEFAVVKDAVPLIAVDIVGSFDKVSLTEMKAIFGYTVSRSKCQNMKN